MTRHFLRCLHLHKTGRFDAELEAEYGMGTAHGAKITQVSFPVEPTGRILFRPEEMAPDCIAAHCRGCKRWTEYQPLWDQLRPAA